MLYNFFVSCRTRWIVVAHIDWGTEGKAPEMHNSNSLNFKRCRQHGKRQQSPSNTKQLKARCFHALRVQLVFSTMQYIETCLSHCFDGSHFTNNFLSALQGSATAECEPCMELGSVCYGAKLREKHEGIGKFTKCALKSLRFANSSPFCSLHATFSVQHIRCFV